jgi:hypothetical protein
MHPAAQGLRAALVHLEPRITAVRMAQVVMHKIPRAIASRPRRSRSGSQMSTKMDGKVPQILLSR